jgi:hypothetical protein
MVHYCTTVSACLHPVQPAAPGCAAGVSCRASTAVLPMLCSSSLQRVWRLQQQQQWAGRPPQCSTLWVPRHCSASCSGLAVAWHVGARARGEPRSSTVLFTNYGSRVSHASSNTALQRQTGLSTASHRNVPRPLLSTCLLACAYPSTVCPGDRSRCSPIAHHRCFSASCCAGSMLPRSCG